MDSNELKRACEMAGGEWEENRPNQWCWIFEVDDPDCPFYLYSEDDPALKPYVAELLVAKVREMYEAKSKALCPPGREWEQTDGGVNARYWSNVMSAACPGNWYEATAEQRIAAAIAVLGGGSE